MTTPTRTLMVLTVAAVVALLLSAGCEREPEGEPPAGQPPDLVDKTLDDRMTQDGPEEGQEEMDWTITSDAFADGEIIPEKYTADGADVSPPLTFAGVPEDAVELALICHDPDAPRKGGWTHWVVYGMAPEIGGLPEGIPPQETLDDPKLIQGVNSGGDIGYMGPAPPPGRPHRYQFRGYALGERLELEPGATKDQLEAAMDGKIIGQAMLEGLYGRD